MSRQTKIINMSLPLFLYKEVDKLAKQEDISRSEILKRSLERYISVKKRWSEIREIGREVARKYNIKTEKDVERIIHEFREEKKKAKSGN